MRERPEHGIFNEWRRSDTMGNAIIGFFYYVLVGMVSLLYRIFGIDPFRNRTGEDSYWIKREDSPEKPPHEYARSVVGELPRNTGEGK